MPDVIDDNGCEGVFGETINSILAKEKSIKCDDGMASLD